WLIFLSGFTKILKSCIFTKLVSLLPAFNASIFPNFFFLNKSPPKHVCIYCSFAHIHLSYSTTSVHFLKKLQYLPVLGIHLSRINSSFNTTMYFLIYLPRSKRALKSTARILALVVIHYAAFEILTGKTK